MGAPANGPHSDTDPPTPGHDAGQFSYLKNTGDAPAALLEQEMPADDYHPWKGPQHPYLDAGQVYALIHVSGSRSSALARIHSVMML